MWNCKLWHKLGLNRTWNRLTLTSQHEADITLNCWPTECVLMNLFSFPLCSTISIAENNRTPEWYSSRKERAGDAQLQGGGEARASHRVVQGRRARQDQLEREQVAPSAVAVRFLVLLPNGAREEGARRRRLLVRRQELGWQELQPKRYATNRR